MKKKNKRSKDSAAFLALSSNVSLLGNHNNTKCKNGDLASSSGRHAADVGNQITAALMLKDPK